MHLDRHSPHGIVSIGWEGERNSLWRLGPTSEGTHSPDSNPDSAGLPSLLCNVMHLVL